MRAIHLFFLWIFILSPVPAVVFADTPSKEYPSEWWAQIPRDQAESWEILPQDAKPGEVILSKRTSLGILSNFAHTPFELDSKTYASVEGFWQMMKYPDPDLKGDPRYIESLVWKYTRDQVSSLSGFEAKEAGQSTKKNYELLRIKWISYRGKIIDYKGKDQNKHTDLIFRAIQEKITQNKKARDILMSTGDLILKPDHHSNPDDTPAYHYYEMLMKIRSNR